MGARGKLDFFKLLKQSNSSKTSGSYVVYECQNKFVKRDVINYVICTNYAFFSNQPSYNCLTGQF